MNWLTPCLIGMIAGIIDVLPMIKMKLDRYSITSAFLFYIILAQVIAYTTIDIIWWLKGGLIGFTLALPTIILAAKDDKSAAIPMMIMSAILGTAIEIALHFLLH